MSHSKLVIKQQKTLTWYISVVSLVMILLVGIFVIGRYLAIVDLRMTKTNLLESQQALNDANTRLKITSEKLVMENQSSKIDLQSNQALVNNVKELQQVINDLDGELKFYRKIMAPELEKSGLTIDLLTLSKTQTHHQFHFRLTLLQVGKQMQFLKGELVLKVSGLMDGKEKEIDFRELGTSNAKLFQFQFKYFQNIQGFIDLPLGFDAQKVTILARTKGLKKNQKAESWIHWQPEESQNYVR